MIRNAVSFATHHHVPHRVVWDLDEKFVCFIIYLGTELISDSYLRRIGFQEDVPFDFRDHFRSSVGSIMDYTEVKNWRWKQVPHPGSRWSE